MSFAHIKSHQSVGREWNGNILESSAEEYKTDTLTNGWPSFKSCKKCFTLINLIFYCVEVTSSLDQSINPQSRSPLFWEVFISKSGKLGYTPVEPRQKPSVVWFYPTKNKYKSRIISAFLQKISMDGKTSCRSCRKIATTFK